MRQGAEFSSGQIVLQVLVGLQGGRSRGRPERSGFNV